MLVFNPEEGDYVSPKRWYVPARKHAVTTQKTNNDIFAAV
jgi:hypothetical protein